MDHTTKKMGTYDYNSQLTRLRKAATAMLEVLTQLEWAAHYDGCLTASREDIGYRQLVEGARSLASDIRGQVEAVKVLLDTQKLG